MKTIWARLFRELARQTGKTICYWKMTNGAEFYLSIPPVQHILDDRFAAAIECPFAFDEIVSIIIPRTVAGIRGQNDLGLVSAVLSSFDGLEWHAKDNEILIRLAQGSLPVVDSSH